MTNEGSEMANEGSFTTSETWKIVEKAPKFVKNSLFYRYEVSDGQKATLLVLVGMSRTCKKPTAKSFPTPTALHPLPSRMD
jgi:hypothetical protein